MWKKIVVFTCVFANDLSRTAADSIYTRRWGWISNETSPQPLLSPFISCGARDKKTNRAEITEKRKKRVFSLCYQQQHEPESVEVLCVLQTFSFLLSLCVFLSFSLLISSLMVRMLSGCLPSPLFSWRTRGPFSFSTIDNHRHIMEREQKFFSFSLSLTSNFLLALSPHSCSFPFWKLFELLGIKFIENTIFCFEKANKK